MIGPSLPPHLQKKEDEKRELAATEASQGKEAGREEVHEVGAELEEVDQEEDDYGPKQPTLVDNERALQREHRERLERIEKKEFKASPKPIVSTQSKRDDWMLKPPEAIRAQTGVIKAR